MYTHAHAAIDDMIHRATRRLNHVHNRGGTDDDFITALIDEFVTEGQRQRPGAGSIHMALTIYRMVIQQQRIDALLDMLNMRDDLLRTLHTLSDD